MDNLTVWNEIMNDKNISQDWKDLINAGILSGLTLEEVLDAVLEGKRIHDWTVAFAG
jgi:hypothetical protein